MVVLVFQRGSDRQVIVSDGSAFAMEYIQQVRNSSGVKVIDTANASSGTGEIRYNKHQLID